MPSAMRLSSMEEPAAERMRINFSWLLKLRWAACVGQLVTILVVELGMGIRLPLGPLLSIVFLEVLSNIPLEIYLGRGRWYASRQLWMTQGDRLHSTIMAFDIFLLSALLFWSGGPANPFSVFYLVNITLAAVVLRARFAWNVTGLAILCLAILFRWHVTLPALAEPKIYFQGLMVAITAAAAIIAYFITRVTRELAQREKELSDAQRRKAENEKLEALATLAAGAAHELASPLSTIAVVARELELQLSKDSASETAVEDARLIRTEVGRCREILDLMITDAGESAGEPMVWLSAQDLFEASCKGLRDAKRVELKSLEVEPEVRLYVPMHALAQAVRGLVKNALDATEASQTVAVKISRDRELLRFRIQDQGKGMSSEVLARAGNPFFTTKDPGKGMGLGLFLARKVIERLGGVLEIQSSPETGTEVCVVLPIATDVPAPVLTS